MRISLLLPVLFPLVFAVACSRTPAPCRAPLSPLPSGGVHPVDGQLAAYNARHIDLFVSFFHPEVELFVQGETVPFVRGIGVLRETYSKMFRASPQLHCEVVRRIVAGDHVLDEERVTGLRGGPPVHAVAIYEVKHGKIVKAWFIRGR